MRLGKNSRRAPSGVHRDADGTTLVIDRSADSASGQASGLAAELAAAAPRRLWNRWTIYLSAALLLVGGFLAGAQVQQRWGTVNGPVNGAAPGGFTGNGGYGNARPGGGSGPLTARTPQPEGTGQQTAAATAAGVTTGTVKFVDGTTVYVQTADGQTITVKTDGSTKVQVAQSGTVGDLAAGDAVSVAGTVGQNSSMTATTITEQGK